VTEGAEEGFLKGGKCITQVHLHKRPYTKLKRANGNMNSGEKEKLRREEVHLLFNFALSRQLLVWSLETCLMPFLPLMAFVKTLCACVFVLVLHPIHFHRQLRFILFLMLPSSMYLFFRSISKMCIYSFLQILLNMNNGRLIHNGSITFPISRLNNLAYNPSVLSIQLLQFLNKLTCIFLRQNT